MKSEEAGSTKPKPVKAHPGYQRVPTAALRALIDRRGSSDVEIFLATSPNDPLPVLYRKAGAALSQPDLDRMCAHGVSFLWVRSEDFHACERELENKLGELLSDPSVAPQDKAEVVHTAGASVARDLIQTSITPAEVARTSRVVDNMIQSVLRDPQVAGFLLRMAEHERSTASHMFVVSTLSVMLGAEVFGADTEQLRALGLAGMMHDLGKLLIPREILNKSGPLTRDELALVQQHPVESVRLISGDPLVTPAVRQMILQHHERVDGCGYPIGLPGSELLLGSKILAIVDSFHAMIGRRAYRVPLEMQEANRILMTQAERQFDGELLNLWANLCRRCDVQATAGRASMIVVPGGEEHSSRHEHVPAAAAGTAAGQRQPRFECKTGAMVQCIYAGRLLDDGTRGAFGAVVHDISRSGLCLFAAHPMYRGEVLHVRMKAEPEPLWLRSAVAWCRRKDADVYKIGLRFLHRVDEHEAHESADGVASDHGPGALFAAPTYGSGMRFAAAASSRAAAPSAAAARAVEPGRDRRAHALRTLAAIGTVRHVGREAQQTAVTLAMSGEPEVRLKAIDTLMNIRTRIAREALVMLLKDANPEVCERAIQACGLLKLVEADAALRELLRDPRERLALRAAGALGRLGDRSGLRRATIALECEGPESRLAAQVIGEITGHRFSANREGIKAARRYLASNVSVA